MGLDNSLTQRHYFVPCIHESMSHTEPPLGWGWGWEEKHLPFVTCHDWLISSGETVAVSLRNDSNGRVLILALPPSSWVSYFG